MLRACFVVLVLVGLPLSCVSDPTRIIHAYAGEPRPEAELATLKAPIGGRASVGNFSGQHIQLGASDLLMLAPGPTRIVLERKAPEASDLDRCTVELDARAGAYYTASVGVRAERVAGCARHGLEVGQYRCVRHELVGEVHDGSGDPIARCAKAR